MFKIHIKSKGRRRTLKMKQNNRLQWKLLRNLSAASRVTVPCTCTYENHFSVLSLVQGPCHIASDMRIQTRHYATT